MPPLDPPVSRDAPPYMHAQFRAQLGVLRVRLSVGFKRRFGGASAELRDDCSHPPPRPPPLYPPPACRLNHHNACNLCASSLSTDVRRAQTRAWQVTVVDLVVCRHERNFHGTARNLLIVWVGLYASWLRTCKLVGGSYPYPFFDKWGTERCVAVLVGATFVMVGFFYVGMALRSTLLLRAPGGNAVPVKSKRAARAKKA